MSFLLPGNWPWPHCRTPHLQVNPLTSLPAFCLIVASSNAATHILLYCLPTLHVSFYPAFHFSPFFISWCSNSVPCQRLKMRNIEPLHPKGLKRNNASKARVMDWTLISPRAPVLKPAPNVMVFGGGAFERWLGSEGRALVDRIWDCDLMKETFQRSLTCSTCEVVGKRWLWTSPDNKSVGALILDVSASRLVRHKCLLFMRLHPIYGIFVKAAQVN